MGNTYVENTGTLSTASLKSAVELERRKPILPDVERRVATFQEAEIRATGDTLTFEGFASVFDKWSEDLGGFREQVKRGAFTKVLRRNPDVRLLVNHDGLPLARSTVKEGPGRLVLEERPEGLHTLAEFVPTSAARDLDMLIESRVIDQMSFGFSMKHGGEDTWNDDYTERTITQFGDLFDVSVVTFPAYPQTDAQMRVCGYEIFADGSVQEDLLRAVANRIHRGTLQATAEERARLDEAFARIDQLSPWTEELARRALGIEPAASASTDAEEGQVTASSVGHWRLAARKRRLRVAALQTAGSQH